MFRSKYKNLVIIGNGFDRWQDLPTSYEQFRLYYAANVDRVMAELGMQKHTVTGEDGGEMSLTDAVSALKTATRRYAKRQLTWFRAVEDAVTVYMDGENGNIRDAGAIEDEIYGIAQTYLTKEF